MDISKYPQATEFLKRTGATIDEAIEFLKEMKRNEMKKNGQRPY